ncbi:MAG: BatA domain-containing protein, partial [Candidatus Halalkalibacterium sp. M3_1C_030]
MNFLNPFFLLGILAVAVPVVIHLINLRRPQKVQFSTLSFLNELKKSTIRKIRIKQYLLMALRALAVLFLALALARPFLPPTLTGSSGSDNPKAIGIVIDNSSSMSRISSRGPLIEQAINVAKTIVEGSREEDQFIVSTTNGEQPAVIFQNAARALEIIEATETENTG